MIKETTATYLMSLLEILDRRFSEFFTFLIEVFTFPCECFVQFLSFQSFNRNSGKTSLGFNELAILRERNVKQNHTSTTANQNSGSELVVFSGRKYRFRFDVDFKLSTVF